MVGIVVVSHSARLAEGVVELAREMGGPEVALVPAGGTDDPEAPLGTDATKVMAAMEEADSGDGVLVLMDLGSAVLSAEMAIDFLGPEAARKVLLCEAPLVEGAVSAASAARLGSSLEEVASEARGALAPKAAHLGTTEIQGTADDESTAAADASAELDVVNALGLHARPAARFVRTAASFDADVRVANLTTGAGPVGARSLNAIATLGARKGHRLLITASGAQSEGAIDALEALARDGFGDGPGDDTAPAPMAPRTPAPAGALIGVPAAPGIAIGPARRWTPVSLDVEDRSAGDPDVEWNDLQAAIEASDSDIAAVRDRAVTHMSATDAEIFDAHLLLLHDDEVLARARSSIYGDKETAARAWRDAFEAIAGRYEALDDPYQAERAADVRDVGNRVLAHLLGVSTGRSVSGPGVLVVDELAPADAASLDPEITNGVVAERGGATSHGAILARSLGIPAVVGAGEHAAAIVEGTTLIVDAHSGAIFVDPSREDLEKFEKRRDEYRRVAAEQQARAQEPARTADGSRIHVLANAGGRDDAARARESGAEGIGLLRTEFMFLDRKQPPSEDEQYEALCQIAKEVEGRPVIVRTLDAGADKPIPYIAQAPEANPFLGVRGARLSLVHMELFRTQLRAILRAAREYPLKIMFPMVTARTELDALIAAIEEARAQLGDVPEIEIGIMVEVPAVALTAGAFAKRVSFFSIGTNDLTQYTLAAERGNEGVAGLADALHPSVLALIGQVVRAARDHGRWVGVCGEVAGDPAAAVVLVGLGVTELSMAPAAIPAVKAALREVDLEAAEDLARIAAESSSGADVRRLLGSTTQ